LIKKNQYEITLIGSHKSKIKKFKHRVGSLKCWEELKPAILIQKERIAQHCPTTYGLLSYCTLGVHETLGGRAILSNYDLSTFDYIVFVQCSY
jgi:hypothetical protein